MSKKRKQSVSSASTALHKKKKSSKKHKDGKKNNLTKKLLTNLNQSSAKLDFNAMKKPKEKIKKRKKNLQKKKKISQKNSSQNPLNPRINNYGAASSDSEPEPIEATWDIDVPENKNTSWKDTSSVSDSKESNQSLLIESSDDLEESETDNDEELDEHELNPLIIVNKTVSDNCSPAEESQIDSSIEDDSVQPNRKMRKNGDTTSPTSNLQAKPQIDQSSKVDEQPPRKSNTQATETPVELTLKDDKSLLDEIRRRSVDLASRSLYISPVPPDCSLERLKQLSPDIISCRLSYNPTTKTCRKYAFLEYRDAEAAATARKAINGRLFAGRNVSAQPGRAQFTLQSGGLDQVDRRQLFVSGLHPTVTRADLHQVFPKAELDYPFHSAGYSLGYAIAKFVNEAVALESFINAHNHPIRGHAIFINYVMRSHKPVKPNEHLLKPDATKTDATKSILAVNHKKSEPSQTALSTDTIHAPVKQTQSHTMTQSVLGSSSMANSKPKVLIQPINDVASDSDDKQSATDEVEEEDVHELFSKLRNMDEDDDETFLRKRVDLGTDEPSKPSNLLTNLFRLQKRNKTNKDEMPKLRKDVERLKPDQEDGAYDSDDEDSEDSVDSNGDPKQEMEEIGDSNDEESDEDGYENEEEEKEEEENGDSDDVEADDDEDDAEVNDETDGNEDESEASGGSEELPSALFSRPPTVSERTALYQEPNASEEEIDGTLRVVMQSRRRAMRALKTAGSKRPWATKDRAGRATKKRQRSDLAKARKPFELPVPTKRQKL